jgi:predicted membrane channel-forming protein YqfA (hemolysin III family)
MGFTYAVAIALVAMGGYRWALLRGAQARPALRWGWLAFAIGGAVCMTVFKWWISGVIALPLLMLAGLGLAVAVYLRRRSHMQGRLLLAGVIALVLAAIFRSLDLAKVGCNPDGWLQFHACWHLCTGTAAFLFWRTLWGERVGAMPD